MTADAGISYPDTHTHMHAHARTHTHTQTKCRDTARQLDIKLISIKDILIPRYNLQHTHTVHTYCVSVCLYVSQTDICSLFHWFVSSRSEEKTAADFVSQVPFFL